MALTTKERDILDNAGPDAQNVSLGSELYGTQHGQNLTLPTSDPLVAGYLWSNSGVVTVSAG